MVIIIDKFEYVISLYRPPYLYDSRFGSSHIKRKKQPTHFQ